MTVQNFLGEVLLDLVAQESEPPNVHGRLALEFFELGEVPVGVDGQFAVMCPLVLAVVVHVTDPALDLEVRQVAVESQKTLDRLFQTLEDGVDSGVAETHEVYFE